MHGISDTEGDIFNLAANISNSKHDVFFFSKELTLLIIDLSILVMSCSISYFCVWNINFIINIDFHCKIIQNFLDDFEASYSISFIYKWDFHRTLISE